MEKNFFQNDIEYFLNQVVPKGAPYIQKQEMRRAFIAGAKIAAHRLDVDGIVNYKQLVDEEFKRIAK